MSGASGDRNQSLDGTSRWVSAGRRLFGKRLFVGLAVAFPGIVLLSPKPFFAPGHRLIQSFAIVLVLAGLALRAWGSGCAGKHTRSATIEAPRLVTGGPFAYVRNPIYTGTMCLGFGMAALIGDPLAFILAGLAFAILYFSIVPAEEDFLRKQFGAEYDRYREAVPRLIPRVKAWEGRVATPFQWRAARGECFIGLIIISIYLALHVEEYLGALLG
jgi:protein-S-isoprenylcysteine O-methyltransferase Ste14